MEVAKRYTRVARMFANTRTQVPWVTAYLTSMYMLGFSWYPGHGLGNKVAALLEEKRVARRMRLRIEGHPTRATVRVLVLDADTMMRLYDLLTRGKPPVLTTVYSDEYSESREIVERIVESLTGGEQE